MTQEQKAKAYDEALERAKAAIDIAADKELVKGVAITIFPELRESEDERIRKEIINFLRSPFVNENITDEKVAPWIAWLEKHKEQKPNSTEDMPYVADEHFFEREPADSFKYKLAEYMTKNCKKGEGPYGYSYNISSESILEMAKEELIKRGELKEQKPVGWSEDDEKMIKSILFVLESYVSKAECEQNPALTATYPTYYKEIDWLKSLRPVKQEWSEEDKNKMDVIIRLVEQGSGWPDMAIKEYVNWFKSLRTLRTTQETDVKWKDK